ncbi:hypothetical protein [Nostoc sp. 'Lobaria pulmonaria (5183) cyanobiont']|uniref:hypothetical protein n=1 Tax=Nostoc sp. 'Lobaria pulmonaria (5183) cyanobiont' TaxID=1618022 RepID=UPI001319CD48|nr:hypothetical protein [Nostoc sp. 'Lobaria pulmonaria (5183) cyanobiont']
MARSALLICHIVSGQRLIIDTAESRGKAHDQDLETEQLALDEAEAANRICTEWQNYQ